MTRFEMDEYVQQLVADYALRHLDASDPSPSFDQHRDAQWIRVP